MQAQNKTYLREISIASISILLTAAVSLAGWGLTDRIHWAAREQQIEDTAQLIHELKTKIDTMPQNFVTRQEFEQVRQMLQADHAETIAAIGHLGDRIDRLAVMDGLPRADAGTRSHSAITARK
jgi:hypothetical protein